MNSFKEIESPNWTNSPYVRIDWWMGSKCNYDCKYCHPILKDGKLDWIDLSIIKNFFDKLCEYYKIRSNKTLWLTLTGGEVTLNLQFFDLVQYLNSKNILITVRTNGSQSLEFYQKHDPYVTLWNFNYHLEYAQLLHWNKLLEHYDNIPNKALVNVAMLPEKFTELEKQFSTWQTSFKNVSFSQRLLFDDPILNSKPKNYTDKQQQSLSTEKIFKADDTEKSLNEVYLHSENNYQSWWCTAGLDQYIIDAYGNLYRGHCRVGEKIGNLTTGFDLPMDPVQCNRNKCANGFDLMAKKSKILSDLYKNN